MRKSLLTVLLLGGLCLGLWVHGQVKADLAERHKFQAALKRAVAMFPSTVTLRYGSHAQTPQKTRLFGQVTLPDGSPVTGGTVTAILTASDSTVTPSGIVPTKASVSVKVSSAGLFKIDLWPSVNLQPQQYYNLKYKAATGVAEQVLGLFSIPAISGEVNIMAYKVTDTALLTRYLFATQAGLDANSVILANIVSPLWLEGKTCTNPTSITWNTQGRITAAVCANGNQTAPTPAPTPTPTPPPNPIPTLASLNPPTLPPGSAAFTLTVTGTGFVNGSIVKWAGQDRTTTYVSATQLTAAITQGDLAVGGNVAVTVFNPAPAGGTSGALNFSIVTSYFVSSAGSDTAACAFADPCSLKKALGHGGLTSPATAGSFVEMFGGVYATGAALNGSDQAGVYSVPTTLAGSNGAPITVRPYGTDKVTVLGGVRTLSGGAGNWVFDGKWQGIVDNYSASNAAKAPCFDIYTPNTIVKNWVMVRCGGGVYNWSAANGSHVKNFLIDDYGYESSGTAYGIGLYSQNAAANNEKVFSTGVIGKGGKVAAKSFGESGEADKTTFRDLSAINPGNKFGNSFAGSVFDMGTSNQPITGFKLQNNFAWHAPNVWGYGSQIGYDTNSTGSIVTGNLWVTRGGGLGVNRQQGMTFTNNTIYQYSGLVNDVIIQAIPVNGSSHASAGNTWNYNTYWSQQNNPEPQFKYDTVTGLVLFDSVIAGRTPWKNLTTWDANSTKQTTAPNTIWVKIAPFEEGMPYAWVTIWNPTTATSAPVNLSAFLGGQSWQAWHFEQVVNTPANAAATFNATPNQSGSSQTVTFNLNGRHGNEVAVFLVRRG